jgi:4-hydroxy-3-methylbut-2-enyl diphosphate reductase
VLDKSHLKNKDFIVEYIVAMPKNKKVKISISRHSGFCFGVKRAIQIAKETAIAHKNVYIKGDLVHNEEVCNEMKAKGIQKVSSLNKIPNSAILIIKAHGEPLKTYKDAQRKNLKVIDATCPMVKDIHKKAKAIEEKGYQLIILGDKRHEETRGIKGNVKKALVIANRAEVKKIRNRLGKKIGIICQSTQNINNASQMLADLAKSAEEILFINTICQPTRLRQKEIEKLARRCAAVLIVGSKKSANTKRLYETAKKINQNSFWITSPAINKKALGKFASLGIIGGASTPPQTLKNIADKLQ